MTRVKSITRENFRPYGYLIDYPRKTSKSKKRNLFRIALKESAKTGWRIAYLVVRDKVIKKLERHPFSFESFEPLIGRSLLYVSTHRKEKNIECFRLDRPVVLKKGIWHGVVTRTFESDIKLTENSKVQCVYWPLRFHLST